MVKCHKNRLYTGYTSDLDRRIVEHQNGRGGRFTRIYKPLELVYFEEHETRKKAIQRERMIKKLSRVQKMRLVKHFKEEMVRRNQIKP